MKKLLIIFFMVVFIFSTSYSVTYTMKLSTKQKIDKLSEKFFNIVDKKPNKDKIYWTIIDTIDGYITLHPKLSLNKKIRLLYFKTLILKHLGYKFSNPIEIKLVK